MSSELPWGTPTPIFFIVDSSSLKVLSVERLLSSLRVFSVSLTLSNACEMSINRAEQYCFFSNADLIIGTIL